MGRIGIIEVTRLFYGDASSVGDARRFVRDALAETEASADIVDAAVLLVSELATNVTLHARTDIQVTVRLDGDDLSAEVKDWNSRMPQPCMTPEDATTGRGLAIVESVAARWGVDRDEDGKSVWFVLDTIGSTASNGRPGRAASAALA